VGDEAESDTERLLGAFTRIAAQAAAAILAMPRPALNQRIKADCSPVTDADTASEAIVLEGLTRLLPGVPVVSEEATGHRPNPDLGSRFLIVDPLDGTREFMAGRDEFTVNIALIEDGTPVAGVVAAPARGLMWRGWRGRGAERLAFSPGAPLEKLPKGEPIQSAVQLASTLRVLVSRSHLDAATDAYVDRLLQPQRIPCGSALKFGLLAEGAADLYPRLAPTSEWDVAAGHAVLLAAGGDVRRPDGSPLRYGEGDFFVPAFIAYGDGATLPPFP
jgi:3'(2'), 5'-bisphosphate nucleotidase